MDSSEQNMPIEGGAKNVCPIGFHRSKSRAHPKSCAKRVYLERSGRKCPKGSKRSGARGKTDKCVKTVYRPAARSPRRVVKRPRTRSSSRRSSRSPALVVPVAVVPRRATSPGALQAEIEARLAQRRASERTQIRVERALERARRASTPRGFAQSPLQLNRGPTAVFSPEAEANRAALRAQREAARRASTPQGFVLSPLQLNAPTPAAPRTPPRSAPRSRSASRSRSPVTPALERAVAEARRVHPGDITAQIVAAVRSAGVNSENVGAVMAILAAEPYRAIRSSDAREKFRKAAKKALGL